MKFLIIDGYIDEPGCLGVPPYVAPLPRYIYGALKLSFPTCSIKYLTIDSFRKNNFKPSIHEKSENLKDTEDTTEFFDFVILVTGVSVPGKYLGGIPLKFYEIQKIANNFPSITKILCGPATSFGVGEEGGKPAKLVTLDNSKFQFIIAGDSEIVIPELVSNLLKSRKIDTEQIISSNPRFFQQKRSNMEQIKDFAILGTELILQHPNFREKDGGNLVCEIETFRGCPRYISGGCAFCIEPSKGKTQHRSIQSIIDEIKGLYEKGARHFRIGGQTDFYAFQHLEYISERYPRPNVKAINSLLHNIKESCSNIQTLHIDNVNALNFVLYPEEAIEITKNIVKYCTGGNIAAIGVESVDPVVIEKNNLKATKEEILCAIKIINKIGKIGSKNGLPSFLPGLNFIMGLPGETQLTLEQNFEFLKTVLDSDLWLRRINLRKFLIPISSNPTSIEKKWQKHLVKFKSKYFHWKGKIRNEIDAPMLKKVFPLGTVLTGCYAEKYDGGTLCRQPGTYPITCFVPTSLDLDQFYSLVVVNYGFRSIVCLPQQIHIKNLSQKELMAIDGIGKKRAIQIQAQKPSTAEEWGNIIPKEVWKILSLFEK